MVFQVFEMFDQLIHSLTALSILKLHQVLNSRRGHQPALKEIYSDTHTVESFVQI